MLNFSSRALLALFIFVCVTSAYGQTKVVVIPMFGDDAASKWLGPWVADTAYKKSEIIEFDGSSYIALLDHQSDLSNFPPEAGFWDLVSASGANGLPGTAADAVAAICVALGSTADCDLETVIALVASRVYRIGDAGPAGGIVFHVTNGGLHGLEAATVDQVSYGSWGCDGEPISGANGIVVGTGEQNTADIIAGCNETTAASVASAYGPGWFLPSKDELNLLYAQKVAGVVGGFASNFYWSSSQASAYNAWFQYFDGGGQYADVKDDTGGVRAVRAF